MSSSSSSRRAWPGPYCGKLLADLGAQVVKCEPADGDPVRREAPLVGGESAFFNYLNENKLGVQLPIDDARVAELARHADIILHSERGAAADCLDAALKAANPSAVVISVTPYGRSGPRADWQASALTEWSTGGYHYIAGDPARAPLALPGFQAEFHAGLHGGVAALAGLWHARNTGEGQGVEITHQEATLNDHSWLTATWTHQGVVQKRTGSLYAKCADGFIYLFNLVPYPNLFILMERFDLLEDEALQMPMNWAPRFGEVLAAFSEWAATRTKQEIYHAAQELRIAASPVNTMADVAASPQLAAREWFGEVEAGGKRFQATGFPYKLSETPCAVRIPAPKLGQHTAEVLSPAFAWANASVARPAASAGAAGGTTGGPLAGLRLIEVTANWAGPIAGRHFADLGADVIKIELATKPATRALIYPNDDLWPDHYNRAGYFNKLNRNKRAICLDLSKPEGKDVFLRLVAKADAVLENNAARVMTQLGVGYEVATRREPGHRDVLDGGLRRDRPRSQLLGLRQQHRDVERAREPAGLRRRPVLRHGQLLCRPGHREPRRRRHARRPPPPAPQRTRAVDRRRAARSGVAVLRPAVHRIHGHRQGARTNRQRFARVLAAGDIPDHRQGLLALDHHPRRRRVAAVLHRHRPQRPRPGLLAWHRRGQAHRRGAHRRGDRRLVRRTTTTTTPRESCRRRGSQPRQ